MLNKSYTEEVDQGFQKFKNCSVQKTLFKGIHKLATRKSFFLVTLEKLFLKIEFAVTEPRRKTLTV